MTLARYSASLPAWVILIYSFINSSELFNSWFTTSYERYTVLFFSIWLIPIVYIMISKKTFLLLNQSMIWVALLFSLLGSLGEMNTFRYIGLAFALAAFVPYGWHLYLWIPAALAWMPAIGWLATHYFLNSLFFVRLLLVSIGTAAFFIAHHYQRSEH